MRSKKNVFRIANDDLICIFYISILGVHYNVHNFTPKPEDNMPASVGIDDNDKNYTRIWHCFKN